jgi:processive 1,2-diacylglycerol beta-glucosyltransferase
VRVLILSAPVGAGHDAAARGVAAELRARGAEVDIDDGLALFGRSAQRLVIDGYHYQITHAPWSWRLLYRITGSRRMIRLSGVILGLLGGRRFLRRIESGGYDRVVSVYPLVSMVLAWLRRTGRLRVPCCALVTDFDPHPAWVHPELDANFGVGWIGNGAVREVRPPVPLPPDGHALRARVRQRLGVDPGERAVLIVGGAWGVGNLHGAARAVAAVQGSRAVIVTGHNAGLRRRLEADAGLQRAIVFGFTGLMPGLMAACDALVANAGGLTCLEAFAVGLPVVMFDPLPGHGADNTRQMERAGMVTAAAREADLQALLADPQFWTAHGPSRAANARALYERPCTADHLDGLFTVAAPSRVLARARWVAAVAVAVMALGMSDRVSDAVAASAHTHHGIAVREWDGY